MPCRLRAALQIYLGSCLVLLSPSARKRTLTLSYGGFFALSLAPSAPNPYPQSTWTTAADLFPHHTPALTRQSATCTDLPAPANKLRTVVSLVWGLPRTPRRLLCMFAIRQLPLCSTSVKHSYITALLSSPTRPCLATKYI